MKKEYKQRHALQNIKEIFLDAFTMSPLDESKDIIEQLSDIVERLMLTWIQMLNYWNGQRENFKAK